MFRFLIVGFVVCIPLRALSEEPSRAIGFETWAAKIYSPTEPRSRLGLVLLPYSLARTRLVVPEFEWHSVLGRVEIRDQLGLTDMQWEAIDGIRTKCSALLRPQITYGPNDALAQLDDFANQADEQLTSEQQKRLREIVFRRRLMTDGFAKTLSRVETNKEFKSPLNVTDKQIEKLRNIDPTIVPDPIAARPVPDDWYERLLQPLTQDQRKKLVGIVGAEYLVSYRKCSPMVAAHLFYRPSTLESETQSGKRSDDQRENRYDGLLAPNIFRPDPVGILSPGYHQFGSRYFEPAFSELMYFVQKQRVDSALQLTDTQKQQLADLKTQHQKTARGLRDRVAELPKDKRNGAFENSEVALVSQSVKKLNDILTDDQQASLGKLCQTIGIRRNGLYASFMSGRLRELLDVREDQRREVEANASQLREDIIQAEIEETEKRLNIGISVLTDKQQAMVRNRLGTPVAWRKK